MLKNQELPHLHPFVCMEGIYISCHDVVHPVVINVFVQKMSFCNYMLCLLFWHHISVLCYGSFLYLTSFVSPTVSLLHVCLMFLCFCMHICMCVCVCMHACCHGTPEEEGRPRRRRTPRFLLKPWARSGQATDSRLGLQVIREGKWIMWLLRTNLINFAGVDNQMQASPTWLCVLKVGVQLIFTITSTFAFTEDKLTSFLWLCGDIFVSVASITNENWYYSRTFQLILNFNAFTYPSWKANYLTKAAVHNVDIL